MPVSEKQREDVGRPLTASERRRRRAAAVRVRTERISARAQEERGRHGTLDVVFDVYDRDAEVGGGIIAGALAYRLFVWVLPLALVLVGGLGIAAGMTSQSPKEAADSVGLGGLVASTFESSADSPASWYALLVGVPILLYVTRSVLRVLIATHRLVWGDVRQAAPKPTMTASVKLLLLFVSYFVLAGLASWARTVSTGLGLLVTLAVAIGFAATWLVVSMRLPHRRAGWTDLVPGALAVGIGICLLQLAAAYLLAPYALAKQGTYGALGIAATLLFSLFLLGRLMVLGAELNATLWERNRRRGSSSSGSALELGQAAERGGIDDTP